MGRKSKLIDLDCSEDERSIDENAVLEHFAFCHDLDPILLHSDRQKFYRWVRNGIPKREQKGCEICEFE